MEESGNNILGKKIFFLYPPTVFVEEIIDPLSTLEYEIYVLSDITSAQRVLQRHSNSLCFVNIDTAFTTAVWKQHFDSFRLGSVTRTIKFGIITTASSEEEKKQLIHLFRPECGLLSPRSLGRHSVETLVAILEKYETKGRRKYVRAYCQNDSMARINFEYSGVRVTMQIRDISAVGMCCYVISNTAAVITKNMIIHNVQISLRGTLLSCSTIVYAITKEGERTTYVLLFNRDFDSVSKAKVRAYVRQYLQNQIETEK